MARLRGHARNLARRSEWIQNAYEMRKNRRRRRVLIELIPAGGIGAELGVHKGHLTPGLIDWLKPDLLYVVDPWYLLEPYWEWAAGDRSTVRALARVIRKLRQPLEEHRAEIVIADDRDFLRSLKDEHLDWVYLDSSHLYEHTLEELGLLVAKVRRGGVIAGDDWQPDPDHRHHGVYRAVREYEDDGLLKLFYTSDQDHQWAAHVL